MSKKNNELVYCIKKNNCFDDTKKTIYKIKKLYSKLDKTKKITENDIEKYKLLYNELKHEFFKKKVVSCVKDNCLNSIITLINNYKIIVPFFQKMYIFSNLFKNNKNPYILMLNEVSKSILDFYKNLTINYE